jgi:hypothetical protein
MPRKKAKKSEQEGESEFSEEDFHRPPVQTWPYGDMPEGEIVAGEVVDTDPTEGYSEQGRLSLKTGRGTRLVYLNSSSRQALDDLLFERNLEWDDLIGRKVAIRFDKWETTKAGHQVRTYSVAVKP